MRTVVCTLLERTKHVDIIRTVASALGPLEPVQFSNLLTKFKVSLGALLCQILLSRLEVVPLYQVKDFRRGPLAVPCHFNGKLELVTRVLTERQLWYVVPHVLLDDVVALVEADYVFLVAGSHALPHPLVPALLINK